MNRYALLVVGSIVTVILDQASKIWAIKNLSHSGIVPDTAAELRLMNAYPEGMVIIENLFHFRLAGNPGAAWGIFGNMSDSLRIPFFLVISAIAIGVVVMIYRSADGQKILRWALTLVMGGAIGNLIDRVRFGYVIDFIDWEGSVYKDYPIFNIADVAISVGVGLLILDMIINRDEKDGRNDEGATTSDTEETASKA